MYRNKAGHKTLALFFVIPDVPSVMAVSSVVVVPSVMAVSVSDGSFVSELAVPSVSWQLFSDDHDASLLWLLSHI